MLPQFIEQTPIQNCSFSSDRKQNRERDKPGQGVILVVGVHRFEPPPQEQRVQGVSVEVSIIGHRSLAKNIREEQSQGIRPWFRCCHNNSLRHCLVALQQLLHVGGAGSFEELLHQNVVQRLSEAEIGQSGVAMTNYVVKNMACTMVLKNASVQPPRRTCPW